MKFKILQRALTCSETWQAPGQATFPEEIIMAPRQWTWNWQWRKSSLSREKKHICVCVVCGCGCVCVCVYTSDINGKIIAKLTKDEDEHEVNIFVNWASPTSWRTDPKHYNQYVWVWGRVMTHPQNVEVLPPTPGHTVSPPFPHLPPRHPAAQGHGPSKALPQTQPWS